jgi:hypothetical protein
MTRFAICLLLGIPAAIALVVATVFKLDNVMSVYYVYCVAQLVICGGYFVYVIAKGDLSDDLPTQSHDRTPGRYSPDVQRRFSSRILQRIPTQAGEEFNFLYYRDGQGRQPGEGSQAS